MRQDCIVLVGSGILSEAGVVAKTAFARAKKVAIISNRKVFSLYGQALEKTLRASRFKVTHLLISEGEHRKTLGTVESAVRFLSQQGLERSDGIVALGGGIVGDVAGFAASIFLRGIPFIQIPTTLVAQIDASIGAKTGVNLDGKNRVGAFHTPRAVIVDVDTLETLPKRELVGGWCETVKQGAVGSRRLFHETYKYLSSAKGEILVSEQLTDLISAHCAFKASIVQNDIHEDPTRTDHRSRRILNFGHTVGHALETVTQYRRFRHGEAVGYGMLFAGTLSKNLGVLPQSELELLVDAIRACGRLPRTDDINVNAVMSALSKDKKSARGNIQWVLLKRIGRAQIVGEKDISPKLLRATFRSTLQIQ